MNLSIIMHLFGKVNAQFYFDADDTTIEIIIVVIQKIINI